MRLKVHFDGGGKNPGPSACAAVIYDAAGERMCGWGETIGPATNNIAEYSGLLLGLRMANSLGATHLDVRGDSELVVRQVNGDWKVKDTTLRLLHKRAVAGLAQFDSWTLAWVPREENGDADELCREALGKKIVKSKRVAWKNPACKLANAVEEHLQTNLRAPGCRDYVRLRARLREFEEETGWPRF